MIETLQSCLVLWSSKFVLKDSHLLVALFLLTFESGFNRQSPPNILY